MVRIKEDRGGQRRLAILHRDLEWSVARHHSRGGVGRTKINDQRVIHFINPLKKTPDLGHRRPSAKWKLEDIAELDAP